MYKNKYPWAVPHGAQEILMKCWLQPVFWIRMFEQESTPWGILATKLEMGFPGSSVGKESTCNTGDAGNLGLISGLGRSPGGGGWQPTPVFLPGESLRTEEPGRWQRVGHNWARTPRDPALQRHWGVTEDSPSASESVVAQFPARVIPEKMYAQFKDLHLAHSQWQNKINNGTFYY